VLVCWLARPLSARLAIAGGTGSGGKSLIATAWVHAWVSCHSLHILLYLLYKYTSLAERGSATARGIAQLMRLGWFEIGRRILSQHHRAATPIDCGQKQASGEEMTLKGLTQRGPLQKRSLRSKRTFARPRGSASEAPVTAARTGEALRCSRWGRDRWAGR